MLKAEYKKITSCMPKTAVTPDFKAHQLGCQNDKYSSDKTSEKKKLQENHKILSQNNHYPTTYAKLINSF